MEFNLKFLSIFIFSLNLYSLELVVNYGKYNNQDYSVLNIKNDNSFECKKVSKKYICIFDKQPDTPVFETDTLFFHIKPIFGIDVFKIEVITKYKSTIKAFKKNLYDNYEKSLKPLKKSKKWVIIGYKTKIPFLTNKPLNGLKFPLEIDGSFYIGAIDIDGNPIQVDSQTPDVDEYFKIVRKFKSGKEVSDDVDSFMKTFPNSLFMPDVMLIKLRVLDEEGNQDDLLKLAKIWLKKYSSNENLPEVILLTAKTYSLMGFMTDATYFYERLFTEYPMSKFSYEAMVYLADQLYMMGDEKKAFSFYNKALLNTKDLEIASLAASRLGQRYMDKGNIKKSVQYYEKVYKMNKSYFLRDKEYGYSLAKSLASHEAYSLALKILKNLYKNMKPDDDDYEEMQFNLALWSYENGEHKEALKYIDKYEKKYQDFGEFTDRINKIKEKLLFEINDTNSTIMLNRYNDIIKKYNGQTLADRALYKKVMLLNKLEKYEEILDLKDKIMDIPKNIFKDKESFLKTILEKIVIKNLDKNCNKAITLYKENNISLNKKYDEKVYNCSFKIREFPIASRICNKYLNSFSNKIALKWSINKEKVLKKMYNSQGIINIVDDICNLDKNSCDIYIYDKFNAMWKLKKYEEAIALSKKIEQNGKVKNLDIFKKILDYAMRLDNNLLVYTYAKKIIELQNRYNIETYTPNIEFLLVKIAKKLGKMSVAEKTLISLTKKNISDENRARVFYSLSNITNDKKYLKKCIKIKGSKTWKPLCEDALKL